LLHFGWRDIVEVAIVAFALYRVLLLLRGTRAVQMLLGVFVLIVVYAAAWTAKLTLITYLLNLVFTYGVFALLIVFQPELRAALAQLGQSPVTRIFRRLEQHEVFDEIVDAVERLSRNGIGAIIAIERDVPLGEYVQSGSEMEAKVSTDLLTTIFTPYSPLHDGAVVVRGDTIVGAGCILPLAQGQFDDRSIGTRHRAAIGLSEETDAIVVVVSEETATISVALHGRLMRPLVAAQLRDLLQGRTPRTTAEQPVVEMRA
jgi:diadenylate cyclase